MISIVLIRSERSRFGVNAAVRLEAVSEATLSERRRDTLSLPTVNQCPDRIHPGNNTTETKHRWQS
jgi:hypothetical protein